MMCDGGMMGGMWFAGLFWLLLVGGGIGLVVWAITRRSGAGAGADGLQQNQALSILRERFARGEITESEYQEQRRVLEQS